MSNDLNHSSLHHTVMRHIVDKGYVPDTGQLAERFCCGLDVVKDALKNLEAYHGVVLHPHNAEVWVMHPFSTAPTLFLVTQGEREWWCNCAWCALGAVALLGGNAVITTTLGANNKQVRMTVRDGKLLDTDYVVHFPVPMTRVWDNVIYTCSTMLLFEHEAQVDTWCSHHHIVKGDVQPVAHIWEFAKVWYSRHLDEDWRKWTVQEASELFKRFGLAGPVWELPASGERF